MRFKKMMHGKNFFIVLCLTLLLIVSSCREDIIPPDNPVADINVPVKTNNTNYYELLINAKNVSFTVSDKTYFNYESTNVYYSINNYQNGSVFVKLKDRNSKVLYSFSMQHESAGNGSIIQGIVPDSVEVDFLNFTGVLNLQLSGYL